MFERSHRLVAVVAIAVTLALPVAALAQEYRATPPATPVVEPPVTPVVEPPVTPVVEPPKPARPVVAPRVRAKKAPEKSTEEGKPERSDGEGEGGQEQAEKNRRSSEEMEEEREKRQLEQDKKRQEKMLKQRQRSFKQFGVMLKKFKAKMDKLEAQGVTVPAVCKEAAGEAMTMVNTVLEATDPQVVEDMDTSDLQSVSDTLQDCGPKLDQAAQLPRIIKQTNSQIAKLEKRVKSVQAKAVRAGVDVSETLNKINESISQMKATVAGLATDEEPFSTLQDLPDTFQDIQQKLMGIEAVFQLKKTLKSIAGQLARYEAKVKRLEAKGGGEEARTALDEIKSLVSELKGQTLTEDTADELPDKLQLLMELKQTLDEELQMSGPAPKLYDTGGKKGGFDLPGLDKIIFNDSQTQRYMARLTERVTTGAQRVAGLKVKNSEAKE
ncbi:MAG: hypothetical protein UY44_C0009G0026 [Candidatus Kaiserbacteria bacterium GW2011_GWA2_49_19]|uniref:Uncharacterized protein n=1 Tax=Candidatus Kaiserbacteria bacterium GW2011_GWA2_49_19 TaxID=1618669 RepID=A0A0G1VPU1_9BACT|nr:MAG: hypothetical protein UY44_C0009G0026 [Candidatus Kaiserbacteria bacterium GW2011_GWA2_49_19]